MDYGLLHVDNLTIRRTTFQTDQAILEPLKHVTIHTDGSCLGNPGPGGYGVLLEYGEVRKELSGGYRKTTNNRMEIMAAIKGLEAIKYPEKKRKPCDVPGSFEPD